MSARAAATIVSSFLLALAACSSDDSGGATSATTAAGGGDGGSSDGGASNGGSASDGGAGATGGSSGGGNGSGGNGGGPPPFKLQVSCGSAVCEGATPVCCSSADGDMCAAYMGSLTCPEGAATLFCDDSGDCLAGQVCCVDAGASAGGVYSCAYAPCTTHEACTPGGTCKEAGYSCVDDPQQASGAKCVMN